MSEPKHPDPFPTWEENYTFLTSPAFRHLSEARQYQFVCQVMAHYRGRLLRSPTAADQEHLNWLRNVRACYEGLGHPKWRPGLHQGILTASGAKRLGHPELAGKVVDYEDVWHPDQCAQEIYCARQYIGGLIVLGSEGILPR